MLWGVTPLKVAVQRHSKTIEGIEVDRDIPFGRICLGIVAMRWVLLQSCASSGCDLLLLAACQMMVV